ncbi:hypothetical protein DFA_06564 [Cavenderia fasciculata]|uniref:Uncharacterized protein n=1 Tax=Cavenderia fasciculata TaxID=261658 RepID=F4PJC8_CACFS|nr:uncharacterized protein DFA_06564 [Cavenderia fasciculata]EGG24414.1 hypothetical protein DFA_06564 [Cavenderia fasciculata]|eukprot:XP_004362265.1 hypothetical protein DFA_06564 [Cavenderia fasciculata]
MEPSLEESFKRILNNERISKQIWLNVHKIQVHFARLDTFKQSYPRSHIYKYTDYQDCFDLKILSDRFGLELLDPLFVLPNNKTDTQTTTSTTTLLPLPPTNYHLRGEQITNLVYEKPEYLVYHPRAMNPPSMMVYPTDQKKKLVISALEYFKNKTIIKNRTLDNIDITTIESLYQKLIQHYDNNINNNNCNNNNNNDNMFEYLTLVNLCKYFGEQPTTTIPDLIKYYPDSLELVDELIEYEYNHFSKSHMFDLFCKFGTLKQVEYYHSKLVAEDSIEPRASYNAMDWAAHRPDHKVGLEITRFLHLNRQEQCTQLAILDNKNADVVIYLLQQKPSLARYYSIQSAIMSLDLPLIKFITEFYKSVTFEAPHRNIYPLVISRYLIDRIISNLGQESLLDLISYLFQHHRDVLSMYHLFSSACCHGQLGIVQFLHSQYPVNGDTSREDLTFKRVRTTILDDAFLVGIDDDIVEFLIHNRTDVQFGEDSWSFIGQYGTVDQLKMVQDCAISRVSATEEVPLLYHTTTMTQAIRYGNINIIQYYATNDRDLYDQVMLPHVVVHSLLHDHPDRMINYYLSNHQQQLSQPILHYLFYQSLVHHRIDIAKTVANLLDKPNLSLNINELNHIFSLPENPTLLSLQYLLQLGSIKQDQLDSHPFIIANYGSISQPTITLLKKYNITVPQLVIQKEQEKEKENENENNNNQNNNNIENNDKIRLVFQNRFLFKKILSFTHLPNLDRLDWSKIRDARDTYDMSRKFFLLLCKQQPETITNIDNHFIYQIVHSNDNETLKIILEKHLDRFNIYLLLVKLVNLGNIKGLGILMDSLTSQNKQLTKAKNPPLEWYSASSERACYLLVKRWKAFNFSEIHSASYLCKKYNPITVDIVEKDSFKELGPTDIDNILTFLKYRLALEQGKTDSGLSSFSLDDLVVMIHNPLYLKTKGQHPELTSGITHYSNELEDMDIMRFVHQNIKDIRYVLPPYQSRTDFVSKNIKSILYITHNQLPSDAGVDHDRFIQVTPDINDPLNTYLELYGFTPYISTMPVNHSHIIRSGKKISKTKLYFYGLNLQLDWRDSNYDTSHYIYHNAKRAAFFFHYMGMPIEVVLHLFLYTEVYDLVVSYFYPIYFDQEKVKIDNHSNIDMSETDKQVALEKIISVIRVPNIDLDYTLTHQLMRQSLLSINCYVTNQDDEEDNDVYEFEKWNFLGGDWKKDQDFTSPKKNGFCLEQYIILLLDTIKLECPALVDFVLYEKDETLVEQLDEIRKAKISTVKKHIFDLLRLIIDAGTMSMFESIKSKSDDYAKLVIRFLSEQDINLNATFIEYIWSLKSQDDQRKALDTVNSASPDQYLVLKKLWLKSYPDGIDTDGKKVDFFPKFKPRCLNLRLSYILLQDIETLHLNK